MPMHPVDGVQLYYEEAGSGPPVLLVHGTGIDADTWGDAFEDLAADHRVVAYDRRGFTRSREAGATPDWQRHADDAAALIEGLGMAPATVVGWSAGAIVALKLALARPRLVSALVLPEPGLHASRHVTPRFIASFVRSRALFALGRDDAAFDGFMRFVCSRRGDVNVWDDPGFPDDRRAACRANVAGYRTEMAASRGHPTHRELGAVRVPVTVVLGDLSDPWFERMATAVPRHIPHATVHRIPHANHAFGFTAPHELAAVIRASVPREGAAPAAEQTRLGA